MLSLIVASSRFESFYNPNDLSKWFSYAAGTNGPIRQYDVYLPLVIAGLSSDQREYPLPWGFIRQGPAAPVGALRDKEVFHAALDGKITLEQEFDTSALPQNGGLISAGSGFMHLSVCTQPPYYIGDWYIVPQASYRTGVHVYPGSNGNFVIACSAYSPALLRQRPQDGQPWPWLGESEYASIDAYSFSDDTVFRHGDTATGQVIPGTSLVTIEDQVFDFSDSGSVDMYLSLHQYKGACYMQPFVDDGSGNYRDPDTVFRYMQDQLRLLSTSGIIREISSLPDFESEWGNMTLDLCDQLKLVDGNVLFLIYDVKEYASLLTRTFRLAANGTLLPKILESLYRLGKILPAGWSWSDIANFRIARNVFLKRFGKALPKVTASAYLYKHYALDSCVSDVKKLVGGIVKFANNNIPGERIHTRRSSFAEVAGYACEHRRVLTVQTNRWPSWFHDFLRQVLWKAEQFGVRPSSVNLYDIIKYSFVVDWFVRFGDLFRQVEDFRVAENYFPAQEIIQSDKWLLTIPSSSIFPDISGLTGDITLKWYHRWVARELPLPPSPRLKLGSGLMQTHYAEASAMIVQRMR